ncbi:MAG: hypothetical protein HOP17_13785, partial [Acidobacteria bacterium]|nr:hypothetical protein [Acidobacteriota bacterium]
NGNGGGGGGGGGGGNGGPVATPTPPRYVGPLPGQVGPSVFTDNNSRRAWFNTPPLLRVPPGAVVSTPLSDFGRETKGFVSPSQVETKAVLTRALAENKTGRILPTYGELDGRVSTQIKVERPRAVAMVKPTGAGVRDADGSPMDQKLMEMKIRGDRTPVRPESGGNIGSEPRKTGAVTRPPVRPENNEPVRPERSTPESKNGRNDDPVRPERSMPESKNGRNDDPVRPETRTSRPREDRNSEPVRPEPQPRKERNDPPPTRSEPVRSEPVRSEPVRSEPPRSEPVRSQPQKSDPPPSKSENKPVDRKGKDNR